jgi:hypothetical protein
LVVSLACGNSITGESCDETAPLVDLKCGCQDGVEMDNLYFIYSGPDGAVLDRCALLDIFKLSFGSPVVFGMASVLPESLSCTVLLLVRFLQLSAPVHQVDLQLAPLVHRLNLLMAIQAHLTVSPRSPTESTTVSNLECLYK